MSNSNKKNESQRKYSNAAGEEVHKELHKFKQGTAHSGKGLAPVESKEQAIAIALSKARQKGEKAPAKNASHQGHSSHSKEGHSSSNPHVKHSGKK